MSDNRRFQSIAERFDVRLQQTADPLRSWRRRATWASGLIALGLLSYPLLSGDQRVFQSRPLSRAHRLLANDCGRCHEKHLQPLARLFAGNDRARSVPDSACRSCHLQQAEDHHPLLMTRDQAGDCVQCHLEHQAGAADLTRVADSHCLRCHRQLSVAEQGDPSRFAAADYTAEIRSWDDHPEFALRRVYSSDQASADEGMPGKRHRIWSLARLSQHDGAWTWSDAANLNFSHEAHLDPRGLPVPPGHPQYEDGGTRVRLQCGACHEPTEDGARMRPVRYEQHCSACHRLEFSEKLHTIAAEAESVGPLPHADPVIIRGILRDRLTAYAKRFATETPVTPEPSPLPYKREQRGAGPGQDDGPPSPATPFDAHWVEKQLADTESQVFGGIAAGCAKCHFLIHDNGETPLGLIPWQVKPPNVPGRWLPHSRFRHDRHQTVDCVDCHYRDVPPAGVAAPLQPDDSAAAQGSIYQSSTVQDILLPSIATCRVCHVADSPWATVGRARADCVECHSYHGRLDH